MWFAQSFASSRAENLPATHAVHSLSLVVVPSVISSPTPQLVTVEWATQAVDELLSSSQEVAPHSVQVVAAEVAARIQQACFDWLDAPILRVQNRDTYQPYTTELENLAIPSPERIVEACKKVTGK